MILKKHFYELKYNVFAPELSLVFCKSLADGVNTWTSGRCNFFYAGKMEVTKFTFDTQGGKKIQETQKFQSDCAE